jgi:hypothetical protein
MMLMRHPDCPRESAWNQQFGETQSDTEPPEP